MRFVGSCWQIAPSSSGHNEPIRLYFYFRHAAYRAIPSLRGGYRDAAAPCTYMYALLDTRAGRYMYGHIRTKIPARNMKSVYVVSRRDARRGTARHGTARHARPLFAEPHLTLPAGSADADADSDAATAAAVRPLSRACTHVRVRTYIIKSRLGDLDFGAGLVAQYSLRAPTRLARLTHGIFWQMSESKTRTPHLPSSRDVRGDVR